MAKRNERKLIVLRERLESFEDKLKNSMTLETAKRYKEDIKRIKSAIRGLEGR